MTNNRWNETQRNDGSYSLSPGIPGRIVFEIPSITNTWNFIFRRKTNDEKRTKIEGSCPVPG